MALYHFTLKSDRKPDGTKIMANEHAEYNGREGKYEELDKQRDAIASANHLDYINRDYAFVAGTTLGPCTTHNRNNTRVIAMCKLRYETKHVIEATDHNLMKKQKQLKS